MKKWLIVGLAFLLAVFFIAPRAFSGKEPIYKNKKVSAWIGELSRFGGPNPVAESALAEMGSAAVPYLIAALDNQESFWDKAHNFLGPKVPVAVNRYMFPPRSVGLRRLRSTAVLGRIGPAATNAVPALIRLITADYVASGKGTNTLRVSDQYQRQEAVAALKSIGICGCQAAPELTDLLTHRDFRVRLMTSELVTNVQPPFTKEFTLGLAAALRLEEERGRQNILLALKRCQKDSAEAWPDLVLNLQHTNEFVRASTAEALAVIAPATEQVVTALEKIVNDERPQVRLEAAYALWRNAPHRAAQYSQCILDGLQDEKPFWRRKAARYAGEMRLGSRETIPALKRALTDTDPDTRILAARAMAQIDPELADLVVPLLRDALMDRSPRRRTWNAAQILGDIGPRARAAVPALIETTDDPYLPAAAAAVEALEKIEPGLLAKLRSDPVSKRQLLMPELIRALGGSLEMRGFAFHALKKLGADAREAVPQMIAALDHPDLKNSRYDWVWLRALDALGAIGPPATNAVPFLLRSMRHQTVAMRSGAASALGKIGLRSPEVMTALIEVLEDDEPVVRAYAARALGGFGAEAREALPALESALRSEELQLHAMAMADAIKKIAPRRFQEIEQQQRAEQKQKR